MKTETLTPQQLFYMPRKFVVPLFQRPYVWTRAGQLEALWEDVARLAKRTVRHVVVTPTPIF